MAVFGVYMEQTREANKFYFDVKERASSPDILKNPFRAEYKLLQLNNKEFIVVADMAPVYPNIIWLFPLIFFGVFLSGVSMLYALVGLPFLFGGWLHTSQAMYLGFKLGARKAGYKGKIKQINKEELIRRLMQNGPN